MIIVPIIAQAARTNRPKNASFLIAFGTIVALMQGCASTVKELPAPSPAVEQTPATKPLTPAVPPVAVAPADQSATLTLPGNCTCPEPITPPPVQPIPAEPPRARFSAVSWQDLPDWGSSDPLGPSLIALLQSCAALSTQQDWEAVCTDASKLSIKSQNHTLKTFFETHFTPYQIINPDGSLTGMITGYYEPLLYGSRTKSERYRYPLYAQPDDLLTVDLASVYPELKNKRLRGRLEGNRIVPYYSRAEIETGTPPLQGKELVWVDNAIDAVFLHIQGSGQIKLDTGEVMRVGYADQNGHPFRSVGRYLIQQRMLRPEQASMQGIKMWAQRNPNKLDAFLNFNPSYVFFRELPLDLPGPLGSLGVPLTAGRSIAIDQRSIPLGVPVYLATTWPNSNQPLNRLMIAQDTGGAINGGVRADFFWGFGDDAGRLAGVMKQTGRMWVFLPTGYTPPN